MRTVVSKIYGTVIHGQGNYKKYCFIEVVMQTGIFYSEIYPGLYSAAFVKTAIDEISKRICDIKYDNLDAVEAAIHIPFISGAGTYQAVTSAVLNAVSHESALQINLDSTYFKKYLSGGTVRTSLEQIEREIELCSNECYEVYKVRLDYRDQNDCIKKIELLNNSGVKYAVDFICNTNHKLFDPEVILKIIDKMNYQSVEWIEEPLIPHNALNQIDFLSKLVAKGFVIALGESLTSPLELWAIDSERTIGMLQLDATINGKYQDLKIFAEKSKSRLGAHNWGSLVTSLQNGSLFTGIDKNIFFEVPIYQTEFDLELANILQIGVKDLKSWSGTQIYLNQQITEVILRFADDTYPDFGWR
jgi:hypothetical protein